MQVISQLKNLFQYLRSPRATSRVKFDFNILRVVGNYFGQMRILIVGLIFISCTIKHETETPTVDGDWIYVENERELPFDYLGIRFEHDTLYSINGGWFTREGKFAIKGDTIIVEEFGNKINKERRIKNLTKDSLIIMSGRSDEKYYSRNLEFTDSLKLNELNIIAGECYGECPEFILKLTSDGLIQFKPIRYCKTTKETKFILDTKRKNKIDSLFKWTYVQKLDTSKIFRSDVDGWAIEIKINYNNGQMTEFRTTDLQVPFRLRRIYGILIKSLIENGLI